MPWYLTHIKSTQSPEWERRFFGWTWAVSSACDLETAASRPRASPIERIDSPGNGTKVSIVDPNGYRVSFVHGQELKDAPGVKDITRETEKNMANQNFAYEKPRQGRFRRSELEPSPVLKAGLWIHWAQPQIQGVFRNLHDHYESNATKAAFDSYSGDDKTCFMHIDLR